MLMNSTAAAPTIAELIAQGTPTGMLYKKIETVTAGGSALTIDNTVAAATYDVYYVLVDDNGFITSERYFKDNQAIA
jgi:hypothetical protein